MRNHCAKDRQGFLKKIVDGATSDVSYVLARSSLRWFVSFDAL